MDKVLLIDAHNAMWRASIGFGPKKTPAPPPPSDDEGWEMRGEAAPPPDLEKEKKTEEFVLIFNFFRNLRPIIEMFSPDKCFFVLEGHPQFRYDLFADYKANRITKQAASQDKMGAFLKNKDEIVRILKHFPVTIARAPNYEADDLIGTLCDDMRNEELTVLSNDSDYIQLLQRGYPNIQIYNPIKKVFMEAPPHPYVAWKSLAGDTSDNIPALLKPKTRSGELATAMLAKPEAFQKFMDVEENAANFRLNRQLIEFRSVPMEEIVLHEGIRNFDIVKQEFAKMDFQSIINDKSWDKYTKTFDCLRY